MLEQILVYPSSTAFYVGAVVFFCILLVLLILSIVNARYFVGLTLSQWIDATRQKKDYLSATKLVAVRKLLDALAHDVLKHRLLGLGSLVEEVRKMTTPEGAKPVSSEALDDFREEIFRLCGVKSVPSERLWTKWSATFHEIRQVAGSRLLKPIADPMLHETSRVMMRLHGMFAHYIVKERASAVTPETLCRLGTENVPRIYQSILAMANGCQMVIEPNEIVKASLEALGAQIGGENIERCIQIHFAPECKWLSPVPTHPLVMCLTRIIDNVLAQNSRAKITISIVNEPFTGAAFLTFKVYDECPDMPEPSQYGAGLRGVRHTMNDFGGGFQFKREADGEFQKSAILSVPISTYSPLQVCRAGRWRMMTYVAALVLIAAALLLSFLRVIGGLPVEFAGDGKSVVEFPIEVGQTLRVPLCRGGQNVRVSLAVMNNSCWEWTCSLYEVLDGLQPCERSMQDPQCPGELVWTPKFEDGQRQGKSYELSVHCISDGFPRSEDIQRIRILVSRPNSAPELLLLQIENSTQNVTTSLLTNALVSVGAEDRLRVRAVAVDGDSDVIHYRLFLPGGEVLTSYDGVFPIVPEWSMFATWTAELEISDNIAPPRRVPIQLRAERLRSIELREVGIWSESDGNYVPCDGIANSRVCYLSDALDSKLHLNVWFDPILPRPRPFFRFESSENERIEVQYLASGHGEREAVREGDRWEVYVRATRQLVASIELEHITQGSKPGLFTYAFALMPSPSFREPAYYWPLILHVSEETGRMPPLQSFIIFSHQGSSASGATFSTRHVELKEFEREEDAGGAVRSLWLYPTHDAHELMPSLGQVICQTPEFSDAFEPPSIREVETAWQIEFKLRRGCIMGLRPELDSKQRLCSVEVFFDEAKTLSDTLWLTLVDRACPPRIEALTLQSPQAGIHDNVLRWRFRIVDTDGDLRPENITVTGNKNLNMLIESGHGGRGNIYTGMISMLSDCPHEDTPSEERRIILRAKDDTDQVAQKAIPLPLRCSPYDDPPEAEH
ncbi:MAG: hypothetical protein FWC40_02430 [Proteobacteria bacterium]|nr:hypothetical protein [Pseudomonadota bacterium]